MDKPVAWRTFDGEGGYDYRSFEGNENYADEWDKRNPKHKGWVEPLYNHPQPKREPLMNELISYGQTASKMMATDQTRFDAACEVLSYLKQQNTPYYYLHRMLTVIHGNEEAKPKEKNT